MRQIKFTDNDVTGRKIDYASPLLDTLANVPVGHIALSSNSIFLLKSENIDAKVPIINKLYDGTFTTGNLMGFVGMGDESLIIKSRFDNYGDNDYFLHYMMQKIFCSNIVSLETWSGQDSLLELLIYLFPAHLEAALMKGLYKEYRRYEYSDSRVRGPISFARHIKENTPFFGNVAYSTREFSCNNVLVQLIRHTIEYIKAHRNARPILDNATMPESVSLITEATSDYRLQDRQKILGLNVKPLTHPFYTEYRALQTLCRLILQNDMRSFGSNGKVYGILFDGAWLWEEYVNTLISRHFHHPQNREKTGTQHYFSNAKDEHVAEIYPDFVSRRQSRIIADAKYKKWEKGVSSDYHQMLGYMYRFDSTTGYFLYPSKDNNQNTQFSLLSGMYGGSVRREKTADIVVNKLGLGIPQNCDSWDEFHERILANETEFKDIFGRNR